MRLLIQRVMVCVASRSPRGTALLRSGSRLAVRLNTNWFVVYIETPGDAPDRIDSAVQRQLIATISIAKELGAEVVRLQSNDVVDALLDFACTHGVSHIVIGRSERPWWRRILRPAKIYRLLQETRGTDVQIVSLDDKETRP